MIPRWSRLALAAILACGAFGAAPAAALAEATPGGQRDDGRGRTTCPCEREGAGPSLVVGREGLDLGAFQDRFSQPLCAAATPGTCARATAASSAVEPAVPAAPPTRSEPTWRLAPKTSPPR